MTSYFQHKRDCRFKQDERQRRFLGLTQCQGPFTTFDREVIDKPIEGLVQDVKNGVLKPVDILRTYGRVALKAHEKTNCVTEVMVPEAEEWIKDGSINLKGPLAGIPISLKDTIVVGGFDTTVGFSSFVGNKVPEDGAIVRLLKDAGAVPYVKTNVPITLLSFESTNDVWGRATNPHNNKYSPGGSTGGEGALLALGGRIGIGSDVAGSVRAPAHFSGIYSLRCSTGRWPKLGVQTSMPGQEGVPSVFSPMTRTLDDLTYFTRSMIGMQPWKYDPSVHPLPWRSEIEKEYTAKTKLRVGVMRTDGVIDPSPACVRALKMAEDALKAEGHEIVEIDPPSPYEGLQVGSQLLNADGCQMFRSFFRTGEWNDPGSAQMEWLMNLPRPFKYLYYLWVKYVRRDDVWAGLVRDWHPKSAFENWKLVAKREAYRVKWFEWWNSAQVDFLLTPPNATPAVPHDGMGTAVSSCGYTFLFNILDYTAGILPVTHVDKNLDQLPKGFQIKKLNGVAQGAYKLYDAEAMHGLPVAVQIVGRRLEEEKVLAVMKRVEDSLGENIYYARAVELLNNNFANQLLSSPAYQKSASFVPKLATKIVQWLDPQPDDVILDVGCGDGVIDFQIAEVLSKGSGKIHGTDSSPSMIETSKKAAAKAQNERCSFEVVDALEIVNMPALQQSSYTKAFSNAAMHWILKCSREQQESFFRGVRESLQPGGTFAFEMGGRGNVSEMRAGLVSGVARRVGLQKALEADPWFFADEAWIVQIMEEAVGGWKVEKVELESRPTPADEGGVEGWTRLMGKQFFDAIEDPVEREECVKEVVGVLEHVCKSPSGGYFFGYFRLRVLARKI